ncbi:MAG TPA: dihydrofolate reductase [Candidatus Paceibacterota bacterium]|nr:dihydrofolate reductase [Candidatus Paceibacterota bacterium]
MPIISLIAAVAHPSWAIGNEGKIPWERIPSDMRQFSLLTRNKPLIMGMETYLSLPQTDGEPLPGRKKIVITSRPELVIHSNCVVAKTPEEALAMTQDAQEVCVIGGERVYRDFLPSANRIYLTKVDVGAGGDRFFPKFDESGWRLGLHDRVMVHRAQDPYPTRVVNYFR